MKDIYMAVKILFFSIIGIYNFALTTVLTGIDKMTDNRYILNKIVFLVSIKFCGNSSVVERCLAKARVAGSNPVSRSMIEISEDVVYGFCCNCLR
jgi:hypothetical protein